MKDTRKPVVSHANDGRLYKLGAAENTQVTFKADGEEVANQYGITEWWMEEGGPSPAPHVHDSNDELMYVLEGPVSVLVGNTWQTIEKGGLVVIPAGTQHTFKNESNHRVGILNILLGTSYEVMMPDIVKLFAGR